MRALTASGSARLIGRDGAIRRVAELMDASPLVTLTGVAGVGKTSLAAAAVRAAAPRYRDSVMWIDLVSLTDRRDVVAALLAVLGIRNVEPDAPLGMALKALERRHTLLVFDNAEHVGREVGDLIETLLPRCPGLAILVTSREPLGMAHETAWTVPSLDVPSAADTADVPSLANVASVDLFVDRARSVQPGFALTPDTARPVAAICRALDGIPLAIEFAAARTGALHAADIAARLDHVLGLLEGPSAVARPRHVTMRLTLRWSYDLLDDDERVLLRRLSVFSGSFGLDSAEAVCEGAPLDRHEIASTLARLVDRSLVEVATRHPTAARYRMLEIVRQFARERLEEGGETSEYERRHLQHFIDVAEKAEPRLRTSEQLPWLERLQAEHGNFLSALHRDVGRGGGLTAEGRRLAAALGYWWPIFSGRFHEARVWLEAAAGEGPEPVDESAARASLWCAWMAYDRNDPDAAEQRSRFALAGLRKPSWHAAFAFFLHRYAPALLREDEPGVERVLVDGRKLFAEAGEAEWGDALMSLGQSDLARITGRLDGAEDANHHALAVGRQIGDTLLQTFALQNLGHVALDREDAAGAAACFEEAIALARRLNNLWVLGYCLAGLGRLAVARKEWRRGARVLSAAASLYDRIGAELQVQDQKPFDAAVEAARHALGEKQFEREWQVGWRLGLPDAIATALQKRGDGVLTERQTEVAVLVAEGLSSREIAERLCISEHTAERHVENILARLRLSSRVQIATWMLRAGSALDAEVDRSP